MDVNRLLSLSRIIKYKIMYLPSHRCCCQDCECGSNPSAKEIMTVAFVVFFGFCIYQMMKTDTQPST